MNDREFNELETIRLNLKTKRDRIDELENEIKEIRTEKSETITPLKAELEETISELLKDKDKRASYDITNQKDWEKKIKRDLVAGKQNYINDNSDDFDISINQCTDEISELRKEIKDLEMEHANKLAYYSQPESHALDLNINLLAQELAPVISESIRSSK